MDKGLLSGFKRPYPFFVKVDKTEIELKDDNDLMNLLFDIYSELKKTVKDVQLIHAISKIFVGRETIDTMQFADERTFQLIKLYKRTRNAPHLIKTYIEMMVYDLLIDKVKKIINLSENNMTNDAVIIDRDIDNIVYNIYDINDSEIEIIEKNF